MVAPEGFLIITASSANSATVGAALALNAGQNVLLAAIIGAASTILAAVIVTRRGSKKQLESIEVKVDGRLEAALEAIDRLEGIVSQFTGVSAPPSVAGQGGLHHSEVDGTKETT